YPGGISQGDCPPRGAVTSGAEDAAGIYGETGQADFPAEGAIGFPEAPRARYHLLVVPSTDQDGHSCAPARQLDRLSGLGFADELRQAVPRLGDRVSLLEFSFRDGHLDGHDTLDGRIRQAQTTRR